ncbi:MAG: SDR family oxidoreductase [Candidatus Omnitrophica bacterium]|nr:SDR family oxidoreductase [Candidatus Omnitrophota bacterium]
MDAFQPDNSPEPFRLLEKEMYCIDLPTAPLPGIGRILVTGASGYIGGRLVPELLFRGYKVRIMVRSFSPEYAERWPDAEICVADVQNKEQLRSALKDVDAAYYLIHSLILGPKEFALADIEGARNFRAVAGEMGLKRIIYLGGLGDVRNQLSDHLQSRAQVAQELGKGAVPVTVLRAAVIVGSGSASYEIMEHLVKSMRVLFIPSWAKNRCQPIAIRDVIKYLVGVLEIAATSGQSFDIGGPDILTYEEMLKALAGLQGKKIVFLPAPFSNISIYAYITSLVTPLPEPITKCLMESLEHEVVCQDRTIKKYLSFENISYRGAIVRALGREEQDRIYTRWSDAYPPAHELAIKLHELSKAPGYIAGYERVSLKSAHALFDAVCRVGGKEGWFYGNWMWRLRGMADRVFLGVGSARGRKSYGALSINDVVDFWRVENVQYNKRLLLRAEMKLPGRAWLELDISDEGERRILRVRAYYDTASLMGKAYWYACLPFHYFLFPNLIKQIEQKAQA